MKFEFMHPADQLVLMMNRIYYKGLTTTSGGNLSIKDAEGNIWITPSGVDKGKLTRQDIVKVLPNGTAVGKNKPSVELPFHRAVMGETGMNAVMHAHSPALVSISLLREAPNLKLLPAYCKTIKKLGLSPYDIPGSATLGEKIAKVFAEGCDAVMMENHGIVVCAENIFAAFFKLEAMEVAARLTLEVQTLGRGNVLTDKQIAAADRINCALPETEMPALTPIEADTRNALCDFSHRSAKANLFSSFDGVYAARTSGDDFMIMPDGEDREYVEPADIVKISGGKREKGKSPSKYAAILERVFKNKPELGAVAVASPVHAMAFGAAGAELDSRTIPESYLMMRRVCRMGYDEFLAAPEKVADILSVKCPIVLVDNCLLFAAGVNLTKCFDSLEVCDFTAKTILQAMRLNALGKIVKISEAEVEAINVAFNL